MNYEKMIKIEKIIYELSLIKNHKEKSKILEEGLRGLFDKIKDRKRKDELGIKRSFENFDPLLNIRQLSNCAPNIENRFTEAKNALSKSEKMINDLLHAIEFIAENESELLTYSKQLQEIRKYRRQIKNYLYLMEPLSDLFKNINIKEIEKVRNEMEIRNDKSQNKTYTPRELHELKELFDNYNKGE